MSIDLSKYNNEPSGIPCLVHAMNFGGGENVIKNDPVVANYVRSQLLKALKRQRNKELRLWNEFLMIEKHIYVKDWNKFWNDFLAVWRIDGPPCRENLL